MEAVLMVDDNEILVDFTVRYLRQAIPDLDVLTASSCCQARDRLANQPIAILIADSRLPDGSGLKLAEEIKARYPHIHTIVTSGESAPLQAKDALIEFMHKPFPMERLSDRINDVLTKRQAGGDRMESDEADAVKTPSESAAAVRHKLLNMLATLMTEVKVFSLDIKATARDPEGLTSIVDEHVESVCNAIGSISQLLKARREGSDG